MVANIASNSALVCRWVQVAAGAVGWAAVSWALLAHCLLWIPHVEHGGMQAFSRFLEEVRAMHVHPSSHLEYCPRECDSSTAHPRQ